MKLIKRSLAIIMDVKEVGESDLLVTFFTEERGKLRGIAKNAKKSKRRFLNCIDLYYLVQMEYESKKDELYFLHSCKLIDPFRRIREDYRCFLLSSYMIELVSILFPQEVPEKDIFKILVDSFKSFEKIGLDVVRVNFEAKVMKIGGYGINLERCQICGRRYEGKGKGVFLPQKGGIGCLKCVKDFPSSFLLDPDEIRLLKILQESLDIKEVTKVSKLKEILEAHIRYILGERLKSLDLLAQAF